MSQPPSSPVAAAAAAAFSSAWEEGMEDEVQVQAASSGGAAAAAASSSSSSSAAAAAASSALSSLVAAAPFAAAAAAAAAAASGPSAPASLRVARRRPAKLKPTTMGDFFKPLVHRVDSWSQRKQQARAREDNAADRAALALESGRLNELQHCFQLGNERLNLPYLPSELLRIISGYAARVAEPEKRAVVAGVVVSRVLWNPFHHVTLEFDSEAAFRAYAVDVIIVSNQLREYVEGRQTAWEEAEAEREAERGSGPDLRTADQISSDRAECDEAFLEQFAEEVPSIHDFVDHNWGQTIAERHAHLEKMMALADPRTPITEIARVLMHEEYGQPEDGSVKVNIIYAPEPKTSKA